MEKIKVVTFCSLIAAFLLYSFTLYSTSAENQEPMPALAAQGKIIWQEKNCTACHQIYGLGGHLGPDLTNVTKTRSPEYIKAFLTSGTQVMPNFHLSEEEKEALVSYLTAVNKAGNGDPRSFKLHVDGTISQ